MPSLRDALEAALVENPDDLATHHAYADYLQEQGDPRGEFIQVQLALERAGKTGEERQRLKSRQRKLLAEYRRDWLGELADELLGPKHERRKRMDRPYQMAFARGWLHCIIRPDPRSPRFRFSFEHSLGLGRLISRAAEARLLRELVLNCEDLAGVRAIVQSPNLHHLTHLRLHWSNLGDVGCTEIVTSGILKRLKVLGLRRGAITDAGASILADCPDLRRLERLDISGNAMTQTGIDALRRVLGDALVTRYQRTAEELAEHRDLFGEP
jgi:uncharacterized protein (TIGR02996 family)